MSPALKLNREGCIGDENFLIFFEKGPIRFCHKAGYTCQGRRHYFYTKKNWEKFPNGGSKKKKKNPIST